MAQVMPCASTIGYPSAGPNTSVCRRVPSAERTCTVRLGGRATGEEPGARADRRELIAAPLRCGPIAALGECIRADYPIQPERNIPSVILFAAPGPTRTHDAGLTASRRRYARCGCTERDPDLKLRAAQQ